MQRFVFLLVFLALSAQISAQYKNSPVRLAVMGDAHLGWLNSDDINHQPGVVRFCGSAEFHFDYYFRPQIAFSTGAIISQSGGNMTYSEPFRVAFQTGIDTLAAGSGMTYKLQFAEIPIGLKFTTREIGYVTLFTDAGVNPLIRTRSLATATDNNHINDPVDKEIHRFNLAYHFDAGIYYSFGNNTALIIAVSYKNTFLDITTDYLSKPTENTRLNQGAIKIGFAF